MRPQAAGSCAFPSPVFPGSLPSHVAFSDLGGWWVRQPGRGWAPTGHAPGLPWGHGRVWSQERVSSRLCLHPPAALLSLQPPPRWPASQGVQGQGPPAGGGQSPPAASLQLVLSDFSKTMLIT